MNWVVLISLLLSFSVAAEETNNFDRVPVGSVPSDWLAGLTGKGESRWTVEADATAPSKPNVLKQSAVGTFPWCVRKGVAISDGFVEVKLRLLAGKMDAAGGLIWRFEDANNYYVAHIDALDHTIAICQVLNGNRQPLRSADVKVPASQWHTLRADFKGQRFAVSLDGARLLQAADDWLPGPGSVGLWTKADSVTLFDDFVYGGK